MSISQDKIVLGARRAALATSLVFASALTLPAHAGVLYFDFNKNLNATNSSVFLFGNSGQTATVSNLAGFTQNIVLSDDGFFNLSIPQSNQQSGTGIVNTGFQVVSPDPIAGYFINRASASTDMTYLFDSEALGTSYVIASQGGGFGEGSQVMIRATEDNTAVTLTPRGGSPIAVTLQSGETYKYAGGSFDLTGSFVNADKPVAVFGGHECAQVPVGLPYCDTLIEQMIPIDRLSTTYLLTASQGADLAVSDSDLVRVIATQDGTEVTINGVVVATLEAGDFYEFSLAVNTGATVVASAPVMVAQYLKGGNGANTDPAMSVVPGADTWLNSYRLSTPFGAQDFLIDYASIVMRTADLLSLSLNGAAVNTGSFTGIAGTSYSRGNVTLPNGLFDLTAANPFLVMLGGGSNADSYFTFGGATFAPGISPPIDVDPPVTGTLPLPGTLAMFLMGLLGLRAVRRRRSV